MRRLNSNINSKESNGVIYFVALEDICLVAKKQGIGASEEMRDVFEGGGGCF